MTRMNSTRFPRRKIIRRVESGPRQWSRRGNIAAARSSRVDCWRAVESFLFGAFPSVPYEETGSHCSRNGAGRRGIGFLGAYGDSGKSSEDTPTRASPEHCGVAQRIYVRIYGLASHDSGSAFVILPPPLF
jgi:hypothetical protein